MPKNSTFSPIEIAAICYEVDRIYCQHTGEYIPTWIDAPAATKERLINKTKDSIKQAIIMEFNPNASVDDHRRAHIHTALVSILSSKVSLSKPITVRGENIILSDIIPEAKEKK